MTSELYPDDPILLVDDEPDARRLAALMLASKRITHTLECGDPRDVLTLLERQPVAAILLDLIMPHLSGQEVLAEIQRRFPEIPVIIMTGNDDIETAVECMREGAADYLVKPVEAAQLVSSVRRVIEYVELRHENRRLRDSVLSGELRRPEAFDAIVTHDPGMLRIFRYIEAIAPSPKPVLITGETGVGKELIGRAIHLASDRPGNLVGVNVAGLDDSLFSDTIFGHVKGAFTGALEKRLGSVEQAAGGTLMLDEIGDLRADSQVKLLRLLQEHEYHPLGSSMPKVSDARIVATTNRNIEEQVREGSLRRDLYYRLQTHRIEIPPLREHKNDIGPLLEHFLQKAAREMDKPVPTYPPQLVQLLQSYAFPGNIRELESMVFDALSLHRARMLSMKSFEEKIGQEVSRDEPATPRANHDLAESLKSLQQLPSLKDAEEAVIEAALTRADGNQSLAAKMLGISRQALNRRLLQKSRV